MLYEHLPEELPSGWVRASFVSGTHFQAHFLFNTKTEFSDAFTRYLALKDPATALVRACSNPPTPITASKKDERDQLFQRREVFMGSGDQSGGSWDARIRSWLGVQDRSDGVELAFSKRLLPIKRESLEELMLRLGLRPYELPEEGWCARTPYHSAERKWRQGESTMPTNLPKAVKEKLLEPLRREVPELADLSEEELASVLFLLKANPPYSLSRGHDLSKLTPEQRARVEREDALQKTRVLTQLFAAREERALRMLREALESQ